MDDDARTEELIALERRFWQSIVDGRADVATGLLDEPALMVSDQGAMRFDHATYRRMAEGGRQVLRSFALSHIEVLFPTPELALLTYRVDQELAPRDGGDGRRQQVVDSSVWTRKNGAWRCVMHTETPASAG